MRDATAKVKARCSNNCMMVTQDALVGRMTNSLISWARLQRGWEGGRSGMGTWAMQIRIGRGIASSESLHLTHEAKRAKRVLNASTYNPGSCVPITHAQASQIIMNCTRAESFQSSKSAEAWMSGCREGIAGRSTNKA